MQKAKRARPQDSQALSPGRRAEAVAAFVAGGRAIAEVADAYGLSEPTLREWVRQAAEEVAAAGPVSPEGRPSPNSWAQLGAPSDEHKAEAVAMHHTGGMSIAEIAYRLKLTESTVREWLWHATPGVALSRRPAQDWATEATGTPEFVPEIAAPKSRPELRRAEAAVAEAKAARAKKALARAETKAAKVLTQAQTAAVDAEAAAREEIAAAYAGAVEAMVRAEVTAADTVAQAEEAARVEVAAAYAAAMEAGVRAEERAADTLAQAEITIRAAAEEAARVEVAAACAAAEEAMVLGEMKTEEAVGKAEAAAARAVVEAKAAALLVAHAEDAAAEAEARVQVEVAARLDVEAAARAEIAAAYAAAVEAMVRSEVSAAETVARAEAAAAEVAAQARVAVTRAEAALADALARSGAAAAEAGTVAPTTGSAQVEGEASADAAAAYATFVQSVVRTEVPAADVVAHAELVAAEAVDQAQAGPQTVAEVVGACGARWPEPVLEEGAVAGVVGAEERALPGAEDEAKAPTEADAEALARAEIAQLVSRLKPVEVWVQMIGRTVAEAREAVLEQLGVDEADAEIEVLDNGSRWLPGRARVRARIRRAAVFHA
jgi:transposase-like protein